MGKTLTLTLFVSRVIADNHDATVATNDLALVTDLLDAWVNLHVSYLAWGSREPLLVAINDSTSGEIVGAKFNNDFVLGKNADVVLPHFSRDVSQNLVTVSQLNPEHCIRKSLDYRALDFNDTVFVGHSLTYLPAFRHQKTKNQNGI